MKLFYTTFCTILFFSFTILSYGQTNSIDNPTIHNESVQVVGSGTKLVVGNTGGVLGKLTVNAETGTEIARFRTNGNTRVYISPIGDVGIGNASPSADLDVTGDTELNGTLTLNNGSQGLGKILTSDANGLATWQDAPSGGEWELANSNNDLRLREDSLNVMIGYNTVSSTAKLHVNHSPTLGDHMAALRVQLSGSTKLAVQNNGGTDIGGYSASGYAPANGLYVAGDVVMGTSTPATGYKLSVNGKIACEEVLVELDGNWPDYVFKSDYDLKSLDQVRTHIAEKGHLPGVPSAQEVEENGFEVGEMNKILMEKVEELTLYILQQEEHMKAQQAMIDAQAKRLDALEINK